MGLVLRGSKGSRLKYTELDGNFTYLLGEITRVEGLTSSANAVRFNVQSLSNAEQNQARANIGAVDVKLTGLSDALTATERENIRIKLGVVDPSPSMVSFKHYEVASDFENFPVDDYQRVLVDYYTAPHVRCVVEDGSFEGQELILRCGTFTGSVTLVKLGMNVLLANGTTATEYELLTNTTAKFVWTSAGWAKI